MQSPWKTRISSSRFLTSKRTNLLFPKRQPPMNEHQSDRSCRPTSNILERYEGLRLCLHEDTASGENQRKLTQVAMHIYSLKSMAMPLRAMWENGQILTKKRQKKRDKEPGMFTSCHAIFSSEIRRVALFSPSNRIVFSSEETIVRLLSGWLFAIFAWKVFFSAWPAFNNPRTRR